MSGYVAGLKPKEQVAFFEQSLDALNQAINYIDVGKINKNTKEFSALIALILDHLDLEIEAERVVPMSLRKKKND